MDKVKISLTVSRETLVWLDQLSRILVPHLEVSRGDVVDIMTAEKADLLKLGTLGQVFAEKAEVGE